MIRIKCTVIIQMHLVINVAASSVLGRENLVVEMIVQWQFMHPIPNLVEQLPLEPLIHLFEKQPFIVWYQ